MGTATRTTADHDGMPRWAEERGGKPACVEGTGGDGDPGIGRIDFPGGAGTDDREHIDGDAWFSKFGESGLAFLYQTEKADGGNSTFFELIQR